MKLFPVFLSIAIGIWFCVAPAVRATVDTVTTTADSGPGSLRNTLAAAGPGDTVVFSSTLAGQTIQLASGELFISQNLTIDASALAGGIIIDGGGNGRILEVGSANVIINTLTVTNGYASDDTGGGLLLDEPAAAVTAMNCVFCGNSAEFGGGISAYGTLTLDNCMVSNNVANVYGGGIFCYGGSVMFDNCAFSANSVTDGGGGAIESEFAGLALNNCTVSGNVASIFGGGIDSEDEGTLNLTNCMFLGNSSGTAGALSVQTPAAVINCSFVDNTSANGAGGGIANYDSLALNNCTLSGNSVTNNNGGALLNSGILTLNNCTLSGNSASNGSGGGVYNSDILTAYNCTLSGNSSANGYGGGLAGFTATNVLVNCTICSNSAGDAGGLFDQGSSTFALTNTVVAGNAAAQNPDIAASYFGVANFIGGNPQLAPLGGYGGSTETLPTMLPLFVSPLINAGTDWVTNFLATDERGYPRRAGAHVDIGAVETQPAPANNRPVLKDVLWSGTGSSPVAFFRFSFTNVPNADFTVFTSANLELPLTQWTMLGNAQQVFVPGNYEFLSSVSATVYLTRTNDITVFPPQQYYRVVSP